MRPRLRFLGAALIALLAGGCWDVQEIDDRETAVMLGFDLSENGGVEISAQFPELQNLAAPAAGDEGGNRTNYVVTVSAASSFAAVPHLQSKTSRSLFFGQIKAIVFSTALARRGLIQYTEFLERHPKIPPQAVVVLTGGRAREILAANPRPQSLPALSLVSFFRTPFKADQAYALHKWELMHRLKSNQDDPEETFIPLVDFDQRDKVFVLRGLGAFHRDRLAGLLSGQEARIFGLLTERAENAYLPLDLGRLGRATYRLVNSRVKTKIAVGGVHPGFTIEVRVQGYLTEMTKSAAPMNLRRQRALEKATERTLDREMAKVAAALQKMNSDLLGLGELLRARRPEVWQRLDWNEEFPLVRVRVKTRFNIQRAGTYR